MKRKPGTLSLLTIIFWVAFLLVFIALLGGYAYRGIFSRYLQDDYCYSAQVMSGNFFSAQLNSYMRVMPYNSDRFSLTLFSGFAELLGGPKFDPFLPALSVVLWATGLALAFREWQKAFQIRINGLAGVVGAFSLLFFIFYLAPNLYQVLYWRSAMFPYLTPLVLNTFLVAAFFYFYRTHRIHGITIFLFTLAAFIAGGFSETVAVWQLCIWGLILLFLLFQSPKQGFALKVIIIPLIGTLLAILIMALGPANGDQLQTFKRPDLVSFIVQPLDNAWIFIHVTLRKMTLPFIVIAGMGFLVGLRTPQDQKITIAHTILRMLMIAAFCFIAVVAVMIPTNLAMSSAPGDRALLPAYFTLILSAFSGGWIAAGFLISNRFWNQDKPLFQVGSGLLGLFLLFYVAAAAPSVYSDLSAYQHRAEAWDIRNAMILEAKAKGETHVVVPAFDSIAQIFELYPEEHFWVNNCAASYYGIDGISAVEGYNGVKPFFK